MSSQVLVSDTLRAPHQYSFDVLVDQRMRRMGVEKLMIYFIDSVDRGVLPYLAEQFNIVGYKGWHFADTEQKQRDLLKIAIKLHMKAGTVWSVKRAVEVAGFSVYSFEEHVGHWAKFRIVVSNSNYPYSQAYDAYRAVMEFKPARCEFLGFYYTGNDFTDSAIASEILAVNAVNAHIDATSSTGSFLMDGSVLMDGRRNYMNETDCLTINII